MDVNEYETEDFKSDLKNLYPKLDEYNIDTSLELQINKLKINNFKNEKKVLEDLLEHYKKWMSMNMKLKILNLI